MLYKCNLFQNCHASPFYQKEPTQWVGETLSPLLPGG